MATDAIISFAIEKLGDLIIQEARFLYEVRGKVEELQNELKRMRSFLNDAEKKQYESKRVCNWISEIRDAAYDAEDVLEDFVLKIQLKKQGGCKGTLKRVACLVNEGLTLHKIGSQVEEITTRLSKIASGLRDYGVKEAMEREQQDSRLARQRKNRESFPHVPERGLVGVEGHITKLVSALVDEDKKFKVVSICGMGGLGKTTLAKQVYNHHKVRKHFNGFAWTFISQQCQKRETWEGILKSLSNEHTLSELRDQELAEKLYDFLRKNKCLVVLDDVWTSEAWNRLKDAFPQESNSKIILTSRYKDVALHADSQGFLYEPDCLNDEQSWELLQKIVFPESSDIGFKVDNRMEELGKHMIKQCAGLPLAIRVLGGMLMKKRKLREWQRINKNVIDYITKDGTGNTDSIDDSIDGVLSLSYEELSSQLKMCFLYLAQFPEDYEIEVDRLLKLWSADGLIADSFQREREDVAESSLDELIERSMVFVGRRDEATSRIQTCRLHDLMRDLCLSKAKQENFATVIDPQIHDVEANFISSLKVRRVAIRFFKRNDSAQFRQESLRNSRLRSLIYIVQPYWFHELLYPSFKDFKFLRVLDLERAYTATGRVPKDLGKLIHLRFLSFRKALVSYFPSSLGKLRLMETLDLRVFLDRRAYIPDVLWKMKKLRHLYLPRNFDAKTRLQLRNLEELRTLKNFPVGVCDINDLLFLTKLKTLRIYRTLKALEEPIMPSSSSDFLKQLQSLSLVDSYEYNSEPTVVSPLPAVDVTPLLPGFIGLSELILKLKITKLPNHPMFPSDITSITLEGCELEEDPMPILEKLLELRVLNLSLSAYTGKEIICSKKGFPTLHCLHLYDLRNLEEWRLDDGGMPCLSKLKIRYCWNLKKLPEALKGIDTLQELEIGMMPKSFKDELSPGGCDFYKIQHVPSVVFRGLF